MQLLLERIAQRTARVVVIGTGYVGLPLVVELARAGFHVTGLDRDPRKVEAVREGRSYIDDVPTSAIAPLVASGLLDATTDESVLGEADAVVVCVPTPLKKTKDPDISYIVGATEAIARHVHPHMAVVLESTTYPGTTRELVAPMLEKAGAKLGEDVLLAFSPERVDPSNTQWLTKNTPKVLGGMTPACLAVCRALYATIIDTIVPVSSPDAAEMVKLLENTFRAVNIGLVNEVAIMCHKLDLDVWEIIDAAASKPFGFMKFSPGPGLGGHCIPIDPLYLSWKLRAVKYTAQFIEVADGVNSSMPGWVVTRAAEILNDHAKPVRGSKILIVGVAYKRDVADMRESPALDIIELLHQRGAHVAYVDPHVPVFREGTVDLRSEQPDTSAAGYDLAIIVTDHSNVDYERLVREAPVTFDTRNATRNVRDVPAGRIVRL